MLKCGDNAAHRNIQRQAQQKHDDTIHILFLTGPQARRYIQLVEGAPPRQVCAYPMSSFTTDSKHLRVLLKHTSVPLQQPTYRFCGNYASAVAAIAATTIVAITTTTTAATITTTTAAAATTTITTIAATYC